MKRPSRHAKYAVSSSSTRLRRRRRDEEHHPGQGLLTTHPNLKVIVAPTTVGILAAAQVVWARASRPVKVTGLGFPNDMKPFVKDGTAPVSGCGASRTSATSPTRRRRAREGHDHGQGR